MNLTSPTPYEGVTTFPTVYQDSSVTEMTGNSSSTIKCNQYIIHNKTHIFYGGYEGIPENLLINFIGWVVSIVVIVLHLSLEKFYS